jgi:hypothetical protein
MLMTTTVATQEDLAFFLYLLVHVAVDLYVVALGIASFM